MPSHRIENIASRSGVAVPRLLEQERDDARDDRRERHLEDGRDHRRQAADVASRVDGAARVAEATRRAGPARRSTDEPAPGQPAAGDDDDTDEPDDQADDAVDPHRLVGQEQRRDSTIANSGTGEVRIAASDDSTDCSAQVMSRNGIVMLMIAITRRWP